MTTDPAAAKADKTVSGNQLDLEAPLNEIVTSRGCLAHRTLELLTTVLGLVPLILFGGALFYGMASVIAFGLIVATVLTLGFVPVMYTLLYGISTSNVEAILGARTATDT